jgi:hypothetical protein
VLQDQADPEVKALLADTQPVDAPTDQQHSRATSLDAAVVLGAIERERQQLLALRELISHRLVAIGSSSAQPTPLPQSPQSQDSETTSS